MPIKTRNIKSLSEYLSCIEEEGLSDGITLFRGQNADWPMIPKIGRINISGDQLKIEKSMIDELRRMAIPHLDNIANNDWEWMAIGQHHGLPTRLLDWTTNALAALWFCVGNVPQKNKEEIYLNGVVWIYHPDENDLVLSDTDIDPFTINRVKVFKPNFIIRRIEAQSGWFTAMPFKESESRYLKLETMTRMKTGLTKIIVNPAFFADIRKSLFHCGINSSTIFPGLDGLCKMIEWQFSNYSDEDSHSKIKIALSGKKIILRTKRPEIPIL